MFNLIELLKRIPEGPIKNLMRTLFYTYLRGYDFRLNYKKGIFEARFKNGVNIKFKQNPIKDLGVSLTAYLKNSNLKKGDVVIDGGAHIGVFTLYASKVVGDSGTVIAFEPDSLNHKKLEDNIRLNNLNNVVTIKKALWSKNGKLLFNEIGGVGGSSLIDIEPHKGKLVKVDVVKLDNELKRLGIDKVDFIKMDIEGAEIEAIKGAKQTLRKNQVHLAIASYHVVNGQQTYLELEQILQKFGYSVKTLSKEGNIVTYAFKNNIQN